METVIRKKEEIEEVIKDLEEGKIVAFPTDTVFGLGCLYDKEEAIQKIYEAKGREMSKSLPMMVSDIGMVKGAAVLSEEGEKLLKRFSPGAFTIILKKKDLPDYVTGGKDTIAIRIPDDEWIRELIRKLGKPLLVTSANLSHEASLKDFRDVYEALNGRIDTLVEGDAKSSVASTIVDVTDGVKILREGIITKEDIDGCLSAEKILLEHGHLIVDGNSEYLDGALLVEGDKILDVFPHTNKLKGSFEDCRRIDLKGALIMPGFFDADVYNDERGKGVTAYIETVLRSREEEKVSLPAKRLGYHLDGPYVDPDYSEVDYEEDLEHLPADAYLEKYPGVLSVTVAYELLGSYEWSEYLREHHILRLLGRSKAREDDLEDCSYEGFRPLFKDMEGFSKDGDALVNIALEGKDYAEVDCGAAGERVLRLLRENIDRRKLILVGSENSTIEGSVKLMRKLGADYTDLLLMSSLNAYTLYGFEKQYGSLHRGKYADILIMDEELNIKNVYTRGKFLYE